MIVGLKTITEVNCLVSNVTVSQHWIFVLPTPPWTPLELTRLKRENKVCCRQLVLPPQLFSAGDRPGVASVQTFESIDFELVVL